MIVKASDLAILQSALRILLRRKFEKAFIARARIFLKENACCTDPTIQPALGCLYVAGLRYLRPNLRGTELYRREIARKRMIFV